MIPYFALLGLWIVGTIQFSGKGQVVVERILYGIALAVTILMVGLRYRVGGDWATYEDLYSDIALQPLGTALTLAEPAYALLNWLSATVDGGIYLVNLACAAVFLVGLSTLLRRQPNPWLAMAVAVPYLVIVVGMGYTRQAAAIGILCWAISGTGRDRLLAVVAKVVLAALFHKTAILFLPILLAPIARRNALMGIFGVLAFALLALFALQGSTDRLVANYVNSDYQSSGATIRIAMNVLAAVLFLVFRRTFALSSSERLIWTIMSAMAIASVIALLYSSSSVGVDRLSLFIIPLQVFVYGNLGSTRLARRASILTTISVLGYCCAVQYVYLAYGTFSYTWLPYRNVVLTSDDADRDGG
ncbi:EpsG family protein [Sphingomonas sp. PAMC 26605]|uniref:EpsG family protein n=1 Tax=Sphingomonas sp. PAMC 26605 TaxID=1112214 RepID=UPI00026CA724|nr:EpsG family protein [Sphingomonas sp. PAMC 26605]